MTGKSHSCLIPEPKLFLIHYTSLFYVTNQVRGKTTIKNKWKKMINLPLAILVLNLHKLLAETRTRTTEWLEGKNCGFKWHCFPFGLVDTTISKINLIYILCITYSAKLIQTGTYAILFINEFKFFWRSSCNFQSS